MATVTAVIFSETGKQQLSFVFDRNVAHHAQQFTISFAQNIRELF